MKMKHVSYFDHIGVDMGMGPEAHCQAEAQTDSSLRSE